MYKKIKINTIHQNVSIENAISKMEMSEKKIHSNSESKINLKDTKVIDYIFSNKNRHLYYNPKKQFYL